MGLYRRSNFLDPPRGLGKGLGFRVPKPYPQAPRAIWGFLGKVWALGAKVWDPIMRV